MRKLSVAFFMLLIIGVQAQELNQVITDPDINREILFGWVDRAGISSKDYLVNEQQKYDAYSANQAQVDELKTIFKKNKKLNVVVVFATWCGDSKAHVPEFFKVADLAKIKKVKYLAVNRKKNAGAIDMSAMAIQRVPTFIVYKGLDEIGRITESPTETIEADLLAIVKKK